MKNDNLLQVLKYIILFFLIVLLTFQTTKLWLDIPKYSMVWDIFDFTKDNVIADENVNIALPSTVGIKDDKNGYYYMMSDNIKGYSEFLSSCTNIVTAAIKNKRSAIIDFDDFDFDKSYTFIYYPFNVKRSLFFNVYGTNEYDEFPDFIDYIFIESNEAGSDNSKVFIHSTYDDAFYEYIAANDDIFIDLEVVSYTKTESVYDTNIAYKLSVSSDNKFNKVFLIPVDNQFVMLNYTINPYIPFLEDNKIDDKINDFVMKFFDGKKISETRTAQEVMYIENLAVIKYKKNGLFEYIEGSNEELSDVNFILDFAKGIDFIKKKIDRSDVEYYLNSYEYKDDGLHIYYDVGYNDIKWEFDMLCESCDMKFPMEVIVRNGKVVNFKWFVKFMPEIIKQPERIDLKYKKAFSVLKEQGYSNFDKVQLVYKLEEDDIATLNWLFTKGEEKHFVEVEREW